MPCEPAADRFCLSTRLKGVPAYGSDGTNRIKGLLAGQGIYDFEPLGADLMRDLAETAHE